MKIKVNVTNHYLYQLAILPYNHGLLPDSIQLSETERIAKSKGTGSFQVLSGEATIVFVPGMGELLIHFLGQQKIENCHDKFTETFSDFDHYQQMVLLRYKTTELYWRFPSAESDAELDISVNELGTLCLDKVHHGEARKISLPEFFIPPVFLVDLPEKCEPI
ncbi:hypothetical protein ACRRS0_13055 [Agarivorans sp. QJM3NY_29]|uniref:hypothetical protein n=1 Tax=unclassified Agarivorans TaxID=2636026 RepID=UPI003D7D95F2